MASSLVARDLAVKAAMKPIQIAGLVFIALGAAVLGYELFSYTTTESVLQIGSITATAERTHTVFLSPLVVAGGCALAYAAITGKR